MSFKLMAVPLSFFGRGSWVLSQMTLGKIHAAEIRFLRAVKSCFLLLARIRSETVSKYLNVYSVLSKMKENKREWRGRAFGKDALERITSYNLGVRESDSSRNRRCCLTFEVQKKKKILRKKLCGDNSKYYMCFYKEHILV